ncbi:MAG: hypothetical protein ABIR83_07070 [Nakamurella sp.]
MTVPPQNGPNDPHGAPQGSPSYPPPQPAQPASRPGYPTSQPSYPTIQPGYPTNQPGQYGRPAPYGQQGGHLQPEYGQMPPAPAGGYGQDPATRPGMVTAAAVLAFVVGGLGLLLGLVGIGLVSGLSGFFSFLFVLVLIVAAVEIWGGVQVINGKDARTLTIAAGLGIVLNLIALLGAFAGRSLLSFVIPGLILYFLLNPQSRSWFDRVGVKHF